MERITRANVEARVENVNRRLEALDSVYRYVAQARNGHMAIDRARGDVICNTVMVGTKREAAEALHYMMVVLDDAADVIPGHLREAARLGVAAGRAAGSWVIDGNTSRAVAERIVTGYEDGDPAVLDIEPEPLSGEWADSMTPALLGSELGISDPDDVYAACEEYESSFREAYWGEVIRSARAIL